MKFYNFFLWDESFLFPYMVVKHFLQALPALPCQIMKQDGDRLGSLALFGAGVTGLWGCATIAYSDEAEHGLAVPNYPWPHQGILSSYDHAS